MVETDFADKWYNISWFYYSTLKAFDWQHKEFLVALLIVPFVFVVRWVVRYRFNQKLPVALKSKELRFSPLNLIAMIPEVILLIVMMLLITAMARPQKSSDKALQSTDGIDIMIALDISRSMQAEDFKPNRLEAAKKVAIDFIDGRIEDRIGMVVFGGDAYSLSPLTSDYGLLRSYVKDINFEMIEVNGTALGSALAVVTNRMRESEAKSKVCILISDGDNNAGNIDPVTAAELAAAYNIKLYTIIVGREGLVPYGGTDFFGNPRMVENTIDETTMRKIARIGGGEFFRAADNNKLTQIFKRIDEYEKAEIKETRFKKTSDYYHIYLQWGICFFLLWLLMKSTFITNVLQD